MKAIFFGDDYEQYYLGHQFSEVFKEQVYFPYLQGKKDLTIVDIGGNIGLTTFYFSHFAERVITVEPSAEHCKLIRKMVEFNKLTNVTLIQKALFIKEGEYPLFHNKNKTMFSLHMAVNDGTEPEKVQTLTLEDLFKQEKINHVDLLKIDIEGSEIEVFSHSSFKNVADKIDTIVTERHAWVGRHPNQLNEALKNAGFTIQTISNDADLIVARK
jgi:FkbM family methyltransferase